MLGAVTPPTVKYVMKSLIAILVLLAVSGCVSTKSKQDTAGKTEGINVIANSGNLARALGCMFAPNTDECKSKDDVDEKKSPSTNPHK